jgi:hypothetical protein
LYSRPRFEERSPKPAQNNEQYNLLNAKLDKIIALLSANTIAKVTPIPKVPVIEEVKVTKEPIQEEINVEKKKKTPKKVKLPPIA